MPEIPGSHEIAILINAIMQPAMAGGLSNERAEAMYEGIMSNIANLKGLKNGKTAFESLRDDILEKWIPIAKGEV